jgi:isoquinoline 1-oxidoreductase beta subunit
MNPTISRRTLLKGGLAAGAGLVIGFHVPNGRVALAAGHVFAPNAWIRIDKDGIVTIINSQSEMGQGTLTSMAMILADELEADWSKVKVEQGPASRAFDNPGWPPYIERLFGGSQLTAGSMSIRGLFMTWRRAGAAAKEMLMAAAAKEWGVPIGEVYAEQGAVHHRPSGRKLGYGELSDKAAQLPVPQNPTLKTPDQFKLIGKKVPRRDTPDKVTGKAVYGIDVKVPGMLVATVQRCPVFGGTVASFDASKALAIKGVRHVVQISSGIAVVADNYWTAKRGRDALVVNWNEGPNAKQSSAAISQAYAALAQQPGPVARREGDVAKALGAAPKVIEAVYEVPFLAHATMEPMNCTAHVRADGCDVWAPTQTAIGTQSAAMRATGLPREKVRVHTTFLGGGFGRRGEKDFVVDAVETSKAVGAPVKVVWSREDDMQHDHYRPATYNAFRAGLDTNGMPVAWMHRIAGPSITAQRLGLPPDRIDRAMTEGAANHPYDIPNMQIEYHYKEVGVPVGFWRSVGASQNAFIVESFIDELAHAAGKDPYEYRRALLGKSLRHKGVLELAATKAGWGSPLPPGRHRGIAVAFSYGSWAAEVAEVSVAADGGVRVHRVVVAIDCGFAVNPDQIRAQMESGIVYGLTAALYGAITLENGRVQQSNFHDYPMLRINEMPVVETHIMQSPHPPGGVGEPAVPPIAPAVANAIFAATGKRIRRLPIRTEELRRA